MPVEAVDRNVFINCPFDADYRPLFEALIFTIVASGYTARCALEDDDAGNIRFDKLRRLIRESSWSIHDLSRTELGRTPCHASTCLSSWAWPWARSTSAARSSVATRH
jgi:hypothetical protein